MMAGLQNLGAHHVRKWKSLLSRSIIYDSPWICLSHCEAISSNSALYELTSLGTQSLPVPRVHSSLGSDNSRFTAAQGSGLELESGNPESFLKLLLSCELTFPQLH